MNPVIVLVFVLIRWRSCSGMQANTTFVEPNEVSDSEDIFTRDNKEYIFINLPVDHDTAIGLCNTRYQGRLAVVLTENLSIFLAEAFSETNLLLDHLWIGGKIFNGSWHWFDAHQPIGSIDKTIIDLYFVNFTEPSNSTDRTCLAMGRKNHDIPYFTGLKYTVQRPFMCERDVRESLNGSTHPGWIPLGKRLYKIYQERVSWTDAQSRCIGVDKDARLAVILDYAASKQLARYLLIGRPGLENAWIGAKYYHDYYGFAQENIILSNKSDSHNYPPWRNGTMTKPTGCILLDRHLNNVTYFVEARCERLRPFICYKTDSGRRKSYFDVIIDEFGYRAFLEILQWDEATKTCNEYAEKYEGKLVEIKEDRIISHLIYVMGQNKTSLQHIWVGGYYDTDVELWFWNSDRTPIDLNVLHWIDNSSYHESVERFNTCLNMDREDYVEALYYGAICDCDQNFVCQFPKDKLIQLQVDEQ